MVKFKLATGSASTFFQLIDTGGGRGSCEAQRPPPAGEGTSREHRGREEKLRYLACFSLNNVGSDEQFQLSHSGSEGLRPTLSGELRYFLAAMPNGNKTHCYGTENKGGH